MRSTKVWPWSELLLGAPEKSVSIPCGQEGLDRNIWVGEGPRKRKVEKCEAWRGSFDQRRARYKKLSKKSNKVHQDRDPSQTSREDRSWGGVILFLIILLDHLKVLLFLLLGRRVEGELFGDRGDARKSKWRTPPTSFGVATRRLMVSKSLPGESLRRAGKHEKSWVSSAFDSLPDWYRGGHGWRTLGLQPTGGMPRSLGRISDSKLQKPRSKTRPAPSTNFQEDLQTFENPPEWQYDWKGNKQSGRWRCNCK